MPRCKPGDLAIVVKAFHAANLGRIVHVLRLHDGQGELSMHGLADTVWEVECATGRLTWSRARPARRWRRKRGPIPDGALQPIRGDGTWPFDELPIDRENQVADEERARAGKVLVAA